MGQGDSSGTDALTWEKFTGYMEGFSDRLAEKFANREACNIKHGDLDKRIKAGDEKFDQLELRIRKVERNVLIGAVLLAVAQWLIQNGFLTFGGR